VLLVHVIARKDGFVFGAQSERIGGIAFEVDVQWVLVLA
jgi:tetrahydromethanopterin S-methyltransferase subunit F